MGLLTKLFGSHSNRELKKIQPIVDRILALVDSYAFLRGLQQEQKTELRRFFGCLRGVIQTTMEEVVRDEAEFEGNATGEEVKERNYELEKDLCRHLIERVKRIHSSVVYGSNKCDYVYLLQKGAQHVFRYLLLGSHGERCRRRVSLLCLLLPHVLCFFLFVSSLLHRVHRFR